ncbi:MAG: hypothetical protein ABSF48_18560 [Thermodesulfobacteriota bacterium]|jgi:hypothetical protein
MHVFSVLLLAIILAVPVTLNAQGTDGLGMWVWSNSAFSTQESREKLVQFCLQHHISHLDVHVEMSWDGKKPILQNPGALRDLLVLAGQKNITTSILRGDPRMFFFQKHGQTLEELRAIITFSQTMPKEALLKGIKYDVEPYTTKEWKAGGKTRKSVMHEYLAFLRKARLVLDEGTPHLLLGVDTPFWWDEDEFVTEFEGRSQRFSEHVQDLTDFIVIMSYWRDPQKVLASVERERKYAERIEKLVYPALETIQVKQTPDISFWGVPVDEFWKTVNQIQEAAKRDPVLGGVRIHNYRGLKEKLSLNSPSKMGGGEPDKALDPR